MAEPLDVVRLLIQDTDTDNALFTDTELGVFIEEADDDVRRAAADACDALAARFAQDVDVTTDGQSMARSQRSKAYAERAKELRKQGAPTAVGMTRSDQHAQPPVAPGGYGDQRSTVSRAGRRIRRRNR